MKSIFSLASTRTSVSKKSCHHPSSPRRPRRQGRSPPRAWCNRRATSCSPPWPLPATPPWPVLWPCCSPCSRSGRPAPFLRPPRRARPLSRPLARPPLANVSRRSPGSWACSPPALPFRPSARSPLRAIPPRACAGPSPASANPAQNPPYPHRGPKHPLNKRPPRATGAPGARQPPACARSQPSASTAASGTPPPTPAPTRSAPERPSYRPAAA
jgi:hypothetical protein